MCLSWRPWFGSGERGGDDDEVDAVYIDRLGVQCVVVRHDMSRLYQGICGNVFFEVQGESDVLGGPGWERT